MSRFFRGSGFRFRLFFSQLLGGRFGFCLEFFISGSLDLSGLRLRIGFFLSQFFGGFSLQFSDLFGSGLGSLLGSFGFGHFLAVLSQSGIRVR